MGFTPSTETATDCVFHDNGILAYKKEHYFKNSPYRPDEYWFDSDGRMIHFCSESGFHIWQEYDDKGNMIRFTNSDGHEWNYEYDDSGNILCSRDRMHEVRFDENGKVKEVCRVP